MCLSLRRCARCRWANLENYFNSRQANIPVCRQTLVVGITKRWQTDSWHTLGTWKSAIYPQITQAITSTVLSGLTLALSKLFLCYLIFPHILGGGKPFSINKNRAVSVSVCVCKIRSIKWKVTLALLCWLAWHKAHCIWTWQKKKIFPYIQNLCHILFIVLPSISMFFTFSTTIISPCGRIWV